MKKEAVKKEKDDVKKKVEQKAKITNKKESIKETGKNTKKDGTKTKKEKKNIFRRLLDFIRDVRKEMKKVHFPSKKDMVKYSVATLVFIVFFSLFFYIIDIIFAFVKSLV